MLGLNMQMTHYLIKYALICISFFYEDLITGWSWFHKSCVIYLTIFFLIFITP